MTQENKQLLLQDLCARLPYGVKGRVNTRIETLEGINIPDSTVEYGSYCSTDISEFIPYLFPLSSMTEEQQLELEIIGGSVRFDYRNRDFIDFDGYSTVSFSVVLEIINWLKEHHFDYRGLIGLGLALDATRLNIY